MLEPVEIEHDECAASLCGFIRRKDALQLFIHPMAIGEAGKRVKFGETGINELAFIFNGYVFGATAIALEIAGFVEFGMTRDRPPSVAPFDLNLVECKTDSLVDNFVARGQLEIQRSVVPFAVGVHVRFKQRGQRLCEKVVNRATKLFCCVF